MLIRKKLLSINQIKQQLLAEVPLNTKSTLIQGYLSFIDTFFSDLDRATYYLCDTEGCLEIDLTSDLNTALDTIEAIVLRLPMEERKDFLQGALVALESSQELLKLAYETSDLPQSA